MKGAGVKFVVAWCAIAAMFVVSARRAFADDATTPASDDPPALFAAGTKALAAGDPNAAIADFEALSDRGVVDANVSFDRGIAYATRVRNGHESPGDLGRAAQSFEEARALSTDPAFIAEAARALTLVRAEIARRRARAGDPADVETGLTLSRTIVSLVHEDTWSILALVFSFLLTGALFVRRSARASLRGAHPTRAARRARTGATIAATSAAPLLLASIACALAARDARLHFHEAVVVAPSAHPADAHHAVLAGAPVIPEGARVELFDSSSGWSHVRWNAVDAWVPSPAVREIARLDGPP